MKLGTDFFFDEDKHLFTLKDGRRILSVTQALLLVGLRRDLSQLHPLARKRAEEAGRRYKRVHRATELIEEHDLDWSCLRADEVAKARAWERFLLNEQWITEEKELITIGNIAGLRYGAILDRTGCFRVRPCVVDIKCAEGSVADDWQIQTAAYALALGGERDRYIVRLRKTGNYQVIPCRDASDYDKWEQALERAYEIAEKSGTLAQGK